IGLGGQRQGPPPRLVVSGGDVTIRGLALETVAIDLTTGEVLTAILHAQGTATALSLLGAQGQDLVQSRGVSPSDPDSVIHEYLAAGDYSLTPTRTHVAGGYTLTITQRPAAAPLQPLPVGSYSYAMAAGDFNGDGRTDLAVCNNSDNTLSVLVGNGDGTFQPQVTYAVGAGPDAI